MAEGTLVPITRVPVPIVKRVNLANVRDLERGNLKFALTLDLVPKQLIDMADIIEGIVQQEVLLDRRESVELVIVGHWHPRRHVLLMMLDGRRGGWQCARAPFCWARVPPECVRVVWR